MNVLLKIVGVSGLMLFTSCGSVSQIDTFRDVAAGGGAAALSEALGGDTATTVAAGAGGFLLSNLENKQRQKQLDEEVELAREEGRQQVMRETLDSLYAQQQGGGGGAGYHEVNVPFDEYVTSDGVILEPHEKTILTR